MPLSFGLGCILYIILTLVCFLNFFIDFAFWRFARLGSCDHFKEQVVEFLCQFGWSPFCPLYYDVWSGFFFFTWGEKEHFWFFSCKEKVDWRKYQLKWNHPITFCDSFPNWWMIYMVQQSKSCTGWISSWVFPVVMSCAQCCEQKVTSILLIRWFMQNFFLFFFSVTLRWRNLAMTCGHFYMIKQQKHL